MTRQEYQALMEIERSKRCFVTSEQAYAQYYRMNGLKIPTSGATPSALSSNESEPQAPSTKATTPPTTAQEAENTR